MTADRDGFTVSGWMDREAHATLMTAISPLAAPAPAADGTPGPRTTAERQGAALVEVARRLLSIGDLPSEKTGHTPHLIITEARALEHPRSGWVRLDGETVTDPAHPATLPSRVDFKIIPGE